MELNEVLNIIADMAELYKINKPYIVGGVPRDMYMKKKIKTSDVDITTNSFDATRLALLIADKINMTFELADDGHVTVFTDDFDLDFSSHFVSEGVKKFLKGRDKEYEEVYSRDFTMNTLHVDLRTKAVFDPTGMAIKDIEEKVIRTPVPASITFTDDPRRIYRAVELASRYNFSIDKEIIDFAKSNPDVFASSKIKDKYVAVKINKAMKENKDYAISLLKELNLFKKVPLVGEFKNILIEKKLLEEYLRD